MFNKPAKVLLQALPELCRESSVTRLLLNLVLPRIGISLFLEYSIRLLHHELLPHLLLTLEEFLDMIVTHALMPSPEVVNAVDLVLLKCGGLGDRKGRLQLNGGVRRVGKNSSFWSTSMDFIMGSFSVPTTAAFADGPVRLIDVCCEQHSSALDLASPKQLVRW
jgi:hypothetical protein